MRERAKQPNYSSNNNNRQDKPILNKKNYIDTTLGPTYSENSNVIKNTINTGGGKMIKYKNLDDIPDEPITLISNTSNLYDHSKTNYKGRIPSPITEVPVEYSPNKYNNKSITEINTNKISNLNNSNTIKYEDMKNKNNLSKQSQNKDVVVLPDFPCSSSSIAGVKAKNEIAKETYEDGVSIESDDSDYNYYNNDKVDNYDWYDSKRPTETLYKGNNKSEVIKSSENNNHIKSIKSNINNSHLPAFPSEKNINLSNNFSEFKANIPEHEKLFFSKEPRKTDFKPYSLEQYRMIKPKEYVQISNLKPDLNTDELVAKRANLQRVKEFAKNLKKFNDDVLLQQDKLPSAKEQKEIEISKQLHQSKRAKALEFAKNISKPKLKVVDEEIINDQINNNIDNNEYEETSKLDDLKAKHLDKKKQIEAIKKSLGLK